MPCGSTTRANDSLHSQINQHKISDICCEMYTDLLSIVLIIVVNDPSHDLKEYSQQFCTGTLIRQDLVLTAASCFKVNQYEGLPDPSITYVHERPGSVLEVYRIFVHPLYFSDDKFNYALILVEKSKQNSFPRIFTEMELLERSLNGCTIGGYGGQLGDPRLKTFRSTKINTTVAKVIKTRQVDNKWRRFLFVLKTIVPCIGDMGSSMICNGELFALFTPRPPYPRGSKRCLDRYVVLFTPVYPAIDWINQVSAIPTVNIEWMFNFWYLLLMLVVVFVLIIGIYCGLMEILKRIPLDVEEASDRLEDAREDVYSCLNSALQQTADEDKNRKLLMIQNQQTVKSEVPDEKKNTQSKIQLLETDV